MKRSILRLLLLSALPAIFLSPLAFAQSHVPATSLTALKFTVNSLADDEHSFAYDKPETPDIDESMDGICDDEFGRCTLEAAIGEAFNMGLPVQIDFSVEGHINLINVVYLPDGSTIDGNGKIQLYAIIDCMVVNEKDTVKGIEFGALVGTGLTVTGKHNRIGDPSNGNAFNDCVLGLDIESDSNEVVSNLFGVDASGDPFPNDYGIMISGSGNSIGKALPGYENTICCSADFGIEVFVGANNRIQANYIGTTRDGKVGYGNAQGILIVGSDSNMVGGPGSAGNIISGNILHGIYVSSAAPDPGGSRGSILTTIAGNVIGLNPLQTSAVPNGNGIVITGGAFAEIVSHNIIAGNLHNGILVSDSSFAAYVMDVVIEDNLIGVNKDAVKFPNHDGGVVVQGSVEAVSIDTDTQNNFLPNTIVGNNHSGITLRSAFGYSPAGIMFRKNLIYQNGVTNMEIDTLSNDRIKPPYGLSYSGNTLAGIHASPNALIDVYKANRSEGPPSAYQWLGSTTTGSNGVFAFDILDPSVEAVSVTATTASAFNTSAFAFLDLLSGTDEEADIPTVYALQQNYPNPFNPTTGIRYQVPGVSDVKLAVYDLLGREVAVLVNEKKPAGVYQVTFDASGLASGAYVYRLTAGRYVESRKMVVVK